ncbi:putative phenylacetaldoxime dehydratase family protein [Aspergillus bombycis]|uniref:Putative phenylacetaldoxime dehydratase family protein n=1 Tax=Aspergillus bombycis TaxID=109264 RepID=A0A1F8A735_9EURO|nr:putative phenylacetaldoxime dehydratase family protein [Aspergillus bombycis]OGM47209.1 putative phenylacetaldoxime dehydratase family protein [Aspergillus bombycis]
MDCPARRFPLHRPANHVPPIPRWYTHFANGLDRVFTAYIGIQRHNGLDTGQTQCLAAIERWLAGNQNSAPAAVERFRVIDGTDAPESLIFVCYWDNESKYEEGIRELNLTQLYQELDKSVQPTVGLWCERFVSHVSRLETNYSGIDYLPGLARLPCTQTVEHSYSAYWGAARDRIPDSAYDLFARDESPTAAAVVHTTPASLGKHLTGTNFQNMVHIRTGQFWNNCDEDERRSYEDKLEPTLREGLLYLWQNPAETGSMGLRYLSNVPTSSPQWSGQSNESCVTGFFRSLADLETWAKKHPSHLAIYTGAIRHAKAFGERRKFRTWHEVSVLKHGDAHFEYLNCLPRTGMMNCISLADVSN